MLLWPIFELPRRLTFLSAFGRLTSEVQSTDIELNRA